MKTRYYNPSLLFGLASEWVKNSVDVEPENHGNDKLNIVFYLADSMESYILLNAGGKVYLREDEGFQETDETIENLAPMIAECQLFRGTQSVLVRAGFECFVNELKASI